MKLLTVNMPDAPAPAVSSGRVRARSRLLAIAIGLSCYTLGSALSNKPWNPFAAEGPDPRWTSIQGSQESLRLQALRELISRNVNDLDVIRQIAASGSPAEQVQAKAGLQRIDRHRQR